MRYRLVVATAVLLAGLDSRALQGAPQPLPVKDGRPVVATINSTAISLDEFVMQLGPGADRARLGQGRGTASELELLDRLVTIKLVVEEASTMGLDELPEIRKQVEVSSREILREVLLERLVRNVRPDPAVAEALYRDMVREWKATSLLFQSDAEAQKARKAIDAGAAFEKVAADAVAAKTAKSEVDDGYHAKADYLPQIAAAIAPLRVGQVSPVVRVQTGSVILKVIDVRYPENRESRAEARKIALSQKEQAVLKAHDQVLRKQHVVVNEPLFKALDYEKGPGIEALLKDTRVIAQIKGAAPVTVGDLTDYLRMQYFHGSDQAKQRREMNGKKAAAFDAMLSRRLLNMEALKLGIDKTRAYRDRVTGYRDSLVFDMFIQKVIVPENKMREEEIRQYYGTSPKEFSNPEMLKARSLAFVRRDAAESAIRKLREGTDFGWVQANADAQVEKGAKGLLVFEGRPVTLDSMPEPMRKALAGSKAGEIRLYASPEGHYYVVAVQQVIAPAMKPYEDVREDIARKLYGEKVKKSVTEYAGKLRAHSKVATYLKKV